MAVTLTERIKCYLIANGFSVAESRATKYVKYRSPAGSYYYLVGNRGSVRYTKTGKMTDSRCVSTQVKAKCETWEQTL